MGYRKAIDVLPNELLVILQQYVEGEYLYIPKKEETKKAWGENTNAKRNTALRNLEIYEKYVNGESSKALAEEYCLSVKSIQGIVGKLKHENQQNRNK